MKHKSLGSLLAFGALVVLNGMPAFGMIPGGIKAKIPFEFRVGSATLPAGEYMIKRASSNNPDLLELRNQNGSPAVFMMAEPIYPKSDVSTKPELVFKRIGNQEYLSQIWDSESDAGDQVPEPSSVVEATPHSASHTGHPPAGKTGPSAHKS